MLLSAILLATVSAPAGDEAPRPAQFDLEHRTIFFAVLEGLYEDGVTNEDLARILLPEKGKKWPMHFVYGCPLCMPALDAFRTYAKRPELHYKLVENDTFGRGLGKEVSRALASEEFKVRYGAIQKLIERWVKRRLELQRLSDEERRHWARALRERKEKGEAMLNAEIRTGMAGPRAQMKGCSICSGADAAAR